MDDVQKKWPGQTVRVVVSGMKYGGALATLNSLVLGFCPKVDRLFTMTFGSPMVLDENAKDFVDGLREEPCLHYHSGLQPFSRFVAMAVADVHVSVLVPPFSVLFAVFAACKEVLSSLYRPEFRTFCRFCNPGSDVR